MMEENRIERRGGRRAGAGRPRVKDENRRVQLVITVTPETRDQLRSDAKACGMTVGRYIETAFMTNEEK